MLRTILKDINYERIRMLLNYSCVLFQVWSLKGTPRFCGQPEEDEPAKQTEKALPEK